MRLNRQQGWLTLSIVVMLFVVLPLGGLAHFYDWKLAGLVFGLVLLRDVGRRIFDRTLRLRQLTATEEHTAGCADCQQAGLTKLRLLDRSEYCEHCQDGGCRNLAVHDEERR